MSSLEQRVQRIEAQLAIQQLPVHYAVAVDSRNLDALVGLFAVDVNCGRWGTGRAALKAYFGSPDVLSGFYRCVHLICGHAIDLVDDEHATGTVYCRAGHEDKGHWVEMAICYFDRYVKSEGRWCFERREEKHWYSADWQSRPQGPTFQDWPGKYESAKYQPQLPHAWPSWQQYWAMVGDDARRAVTDTP